MVAGGRLPRQQSIRLSGVGGAGKHYGVAGWQIELLPRQSVDKLYLQQVND